MAVDSLFGAPKVSQVTPKVPVSSGIDSLFGGRTTSPKASVLAIQADKAQQQAQQANSFTGVVKNTGADIKSFIGGLFSDTKKTLLAPFSPKPNLIKDPYASLNAGIASQRSSIQDAGDRLNTAVETIANNHATALDKGVAVGEAGVGALNVLFSTVTAPLAAMGTVPIVGHAVDIVNNVFGALGTAGADIAEKSIGGLPVSNQTKQKITPLVREIGGLTAQIVAGKVGGDVFKKVIAKSNAVVDLVKEDVSKRVPVISQTEEPRPVKINTPTTKHADYASSQGYEPITPSDKLPIIQMGPKPTQKLPSIQIGSPKPPELPGYKLEPVSPIKNPVRPDSVPVTEETTPTASEPLKPRAGAQKPIEGTGELKTRSLSQGIEAKAIENKLTDNFGDLPEYQQVSMADQASKAADFIAKKPQEAIDVAMGRKAPPRGVLPESVLVAVENKALAEGDVATLRDLATNSHLSYEATTMGQRIRTLGERDPSSPVGAIKAVQEAREANLKEKGITMAKEVEKVAKEVRAHVKEAISKRPAWEDFVREIQCNY